LGFLSSIENSAFSEWLRTSSSLWGYPAILFLHTAGLAIVVGFSVVVDLRLLGFARRVPVAPLEGFFPIMWGGFWINVVSGAILLAEDATTKIASPVFGIKMILIGLAIADMMLIRRVVFRHPVIDKSVSSTGKCLAGASILLWSGATTAGRLMAYLGSVPGLPGVTNRIGG
jgi:hypothetical protein